MTTYTCTPHYSIRHAHTHIILYTPHLSYHTIVPFQNGELDHEEMMKKFNLFKTTLDKMRSALSEDNGADQYEKEEEEETDKEPSGEDDLHDEL